MMEFKNNCDWDQRVYAGTSTMDVLSDIVPAHDSAVVILRTHYALVLTGSPGTEGGFSFNFSHRAERVFNGKKQTCQASHRTIRVNWIFQAPADGASAGPSTLEPIVVVLEQSEDGGTPPTRVDPPRTTPRALPFTPPPADRVCPPCQAIADAIALFEGHRKDLERSLGDLDERLALLERESDLDARAGTKNDAQQTRNEQIANTRREAGGVKAEIALIASEIDALRRRLEDCTQACSALGPASAIGFVPGARLPPGAGCIECQEIAELLIAAEEKTSALEREIWARFRDGRKIQDLPTELTVARHSADLYRHQLDICNARCVATPASTTTAPVTQPITATTRNVGATTDTPAVGIPEADGCGGATDCIPLDSCTGGGTCGDLPAAGGLEENYQSIGAETIRVQISVTPQQARRDQNPMGLLSRSVSEFINWWMPALEAAEQNLQKGLQFLITSQGGSTGKNLTMQVLNFTGKPVSLQGMIALEPLKKDAQQRVTQAFSKLAGRQLPTKVDLSAYCLEFLKLPPIAGQVMRVAPPDVQKRFAPMKRVMAAANRLAQTGALKPDSNPAAYADSIKQWAIWTAQEKFDQSKFADAFVNHTRKNVEAAGQKWSKAIEDQIRRVAPNRWNDITQILTLARP